MAVKIVTSNGQTVQSFEDWKNGGKSPNGSQQAASYSGPQIVSSSGQTIQSFEEWRQNRTSGVTPGGDSAIMDWMDRYNRVMQGVSSYEKKRNGGFTQDASGGFGSEIDSLIADYDGIERYAADYGFRYGICHDAQRFHFAPCKPHRNRRAIFRCAESFPGSHTGGYCGYRDLLR